MKRTELLCLLLAATIGINAGAQGYIRDDAGATHSPTPAPARMEAPRMEQPSASITEPVIPRYDERGRPNPDAFEWTGIALGLHAGTLGVGAESTFHLMRSLNFRIAATYLSATYKKTIERIDFDYDLEFLGARLLLDIYPTRLKNFRISAGLVVSDMEVVVSGTPDRNVLLGGNVYTPDEMGRLRGTASYEVVAPYFGIGFGNSVKPDTLLMFSMDIGVMLQDYSFRLSSSGTAAGSDQFREDSRAVESELEDVLDWLKFYPVISFGLSYHF